MQENLKEKADAKKLSLVCTSQCHFFGRAIAALRNVLNYAWLTNSPALEFSCDGLGECVHS